MLEHHTKIYRRVYLAEHMLYSVLQVMHTQVKKETNKKNCKVYTADRETIK